jgi:hypothetical protein
MVAGSLHNVGNTTFCLSQKTKYLKLEQSAVLRRDNQFIVPTLGGSGPFQPGSFITFEFNRIGFIDLNSLTFEFSITTPDVLIGGVKNFTPKFKTDAGSIFKRVQIMFGSQALIDYQDYDVINSFIVNASTPYLNLMHSCNILNGYTDPEADFIEAQTPFDTSQAFSKPPFTYVGSGIKNSTKTAEGFGAQTHLHAFKIGFFSIQQYFPAQLFQNFRMVLELNTPQNSISLYDNHSLTNRGNKIDSTACASYNVTNARLYYDIVEMDPVFQDATRKLAQEDSLYIPFIQLNRHLYTIPLDLVSGNRVSLDITEKVGSLKALFLLPIPANHYASNNAESAREVFTFQQPILGANIRTEDNISNFQLKLAGTYFPLYPAITFTEIKYLLLQSLSLVNDNTGAGVFPPYSSGRNIPGYYNSTTAIANNTDRSATYASKYPRIFNIYGFDFDREECSELLCGTNTVEPQSSINISFTNNTTTRAVATRLIVLTLFNSTLRLLSSGNIDILR